MSLDTRQTPAAFLLAWHSLEQNRSVSGTLSQYFSFHIIPLPLPGFYESCVTETSPSNFRLRLFITETFPKAGWVMSGEGWRVALRLSEMRVRNYESCDGTLGGGERGIQARSIEALFLFPARLKFCPDSYGGERLCFPSWSGLMSGGGASLLTELKRKRSPRHPGYSPAAGAPPAWTSMASSLLPTCL